MLTGMPSSKVVSPTRLWNEGLGYTTKVLFRFWMETTPSISSPNPTCIGVGVLSFSSTEGAGQRSVVPSLPTWSHEGEVSVVTASCSTICRRPRPLATPTWMRRRGFCIALKLVPLTVKIVPPLKKNDTNKIKRRKYKKKWEHLLLGVRV